jgi:hypothetical protein
MIGNNNYKHIIFGFRKKYVIIVIVIIKLI